MINHMRGKESTNQLMKCRVVSFIPMAYGTAANIIRMGHGVVEL